MPTDQETAAAEAAKAAEAEAAKKAAEAAAADETEEFHVDGMGSVKLTKEQRTRAVHYGLHAAARDQAAKKEAEAKAAEEARKNEEAAAEQLKQKPGESNSAFEKRIERLEARLAEQDRVANDRGQIERIEQLVAAEELGEWSGDAAEKITMRLAIMRARNPNVTVDEVAKMVLPDFKKKVSRYQPINVEKKIADGDKTRKLAGGGKTAAGGNEPKPLDRRSFRDGSLLKRVAANMKARLGE